MLVFLFQVFLSKRYMGFAVFGYLNDLSSCVSCLRNALTIRGKTKTWKYLIISIANLGTFGLYCN
jgi:hypothetical protein